MFYALVYYPRIEHAGFHTFRNKYEPYSFLIEDHIPLIYPVPDSIGEEGISKHIENVLNDWNPFEIHISGFEKTVDHWLMLILKKGNDLVIRLHDQLYQDILASYLQKDLPYVPHVGLGLFSKEAYDFNNPTAELTLDQERYQDALAELKQMELDFHRTIDNLTLVRVNDDFTKCWDVRDFPF